jgi:phosphoribosylglycinamide formyltransferase-1
MTAGAATPLRLAVLISGRGSNMVAIAQACAAGHIPARIGIVISDQPAAAGLLRATELGIPVDSFTGRFDRNRFEAMVQQHIEHLQVDLVVLAGFMRILSPQFTTRHAGRMLNIHPSLLPRFPGLDTHARVIAAGDAEHGASVHYVTPELDGGPVVLQGRVPVLPTDSVETLSARVHAIEHRLYPEVIGWIGERRLQWCAGRPELDGEPLDPPRQWRQE